MADDLVFRLRERARIRRQIPGRRSVQEGKPDRIADLLVEAATEIERLQGMVRAWENSPMYRIDKSTGPRKQP